MTPNKKHIPRTPSYSQIREGETDPPISIRMLESGLAFSVWVTPRSSMNACHGFREGALKVKLQAPPADGQANQKLLEWIAQLFNCAPSRLQLIQGGASRLKWISVSGFSEDTLRRVLLQAGKSTGYGDENKNS